MLFNFKKLTEKGLFITDLFNVVFKMHGTMHLKTENNTETISKVFNGKKIGLSLCKLDDSLIVFFFFCNDDKHCYSLSRVSFDKWFD